MALLPDELLEKEDDKLCQIPKEYAEKIIISSAGSKLNWKYFKSGGSIFQTILIVLGFVLVESLFLFSDIWLATWCVNPA